jgi:tRNA threonylcarbamoyladenosine biosynthesis protein TsaB
MRVLAIDTALASCAAAVFDSSAGVVVAFEAVPMERGHAEALMPLIARVMDGAGCEFADLDRIAVTVGPGSFTGLRVGISAARGLALASGRPAVGLSTLAAFAAPHVAQRTGETIVAAIDARHEQAYVQVFEPGGTTLVAPRIERVRDAARAVPDAATRIVGSAAELLAAHWPAGGHVPLVLQSTAPDIGWVARLGAAAPDGQAVPKPLYLRRPDARPHNAARLLRR